MPADKITYVTDVLTDLDTMLTVIGAIPSQV